MLKLVVYKATNVTKLLNNAMAKTIDSTPFVKIFPTCAQKDVTMNIHVQMYSIIGDGLWLIIWVYYDSHGT
jgi:hypothetical protein